MKELGNSRMATMSYMNASHLRRPFRALALALIEISHVEYLMIRDINLNGHDYRNYKSKQC